MAPPKMGKSLASKDSVLKGGALGIIGGALSVIRGCCIWLLKSSMVSLTSPAYLFRLSTMGHDVSSYPVLRTVPRYTLVFKPFRFL